MLGKLAGKPNQIPINLEVLRDFPVFGFPLNHNSLIFSHGMPGVFHMCFISKRRGGPLGATRDILFQRLAEMMGVGCGKTPHFLSVKLQILVP
jgi:hypothetical protein